MKSRSYRLLALLLFAVVTASAATAQPSGPRTLFEIGVGPSASSKPSWAQSGIGIGAGAVLRLTSRTHFGRIGAEWLSWFGRGEEYFADGFPSPTRPPREPRTEQVLLRRAAISAVAQVDGPGVLSFKAGLGGALVEGIEQCECLDAFINTRERRLTPVVTLGLGVRNRDVGSRRLSPAFDVLLPASGRGSALASLSLVVRWAGRGD